MQDLQEDTQAKLNQMWEALTKRSDEMETRNQGTRAELLTAISSSMELIKGLGDAVERIELTDMAEVAKHMESLAQAMEEEQSVVRQLLEDNAKVWLTPSVHTAKEHTIPFSWCNVSAACLAVVYVVDMNLCPCSTCRRQEQSCKRQSLIFKLRWMVCGIQ